MKVKYKDIFHLKNMYVMMHEYLIEEGFLDEDQKGGQAGHQYIEKMYMEKFCQKGLHAGGKEMWIWWRTIKRPETKTLDIYFYDLCIESQNEVLEFYGMTDASEGNFEISPLAILEVELDED